MEIFDVLKIILIGIIEGVTEWLPVSSTGHMIIVSNLWEIFGGKFWSDKFSLGFSDVFDYAIQLGAIIAVIVVFFQRIFPLKIDNIKVNGVVEKRKLFIDKAVVSTWVKVIVACIPALVAILVDELLEGIGTTAETIIIACMLILYGIAFIVIENLNRNRIAKVQSVGEMTLKTAFFIGCFQVLASIPGTSRSGITIIGALLLGVSRTVSAEFTFFLAIPTMIGASGFKILKFILGGATFSSTEIWALLLGMVVAFAVSMFVIKGLMAFVKKHDFKPFGWYRIILGIVVILICLIIPR